MTLQQLKYVTTVAQTGTISDAARKLFISQPSLTKAVRELEKEMGITIFERTNRGIVISKEGETFLGYARQVLEQAALLEETYKKKAGRKQEFSVSTQHYSFAVNAFVELIERYGSEKYDFCLRETQTYEIIEDVAQMKSEIGILYLNDFNRTVLEKLIKIESIKKYPEDTELLEDVIIENTQAIEMANIYSGILRSMMDAFASVISNNLNDVMKILSVITIVMSIPTIIFSAYGMNLAPSGMPFSSTTLGFAIVILISIGASIVAAMFLSKKKYF